MKFIAHSWFGRVSGAEASGSRTSRLRRLRCTASPSSAYSRYTRFTFTACPRRSRKANVRKRYGKAGSRAAADSRSAASAAPASSVPRAAPRCSPGATYYSDPLDRTLREEYSIEMIAPNRRNRSRTQDGCKLRRYRRRWKVERLFAWMHNFRRLVTRWEYQSRTSSASSTSPACICCSDSYETSSSLAQSLPFRSNALFLTTATPASVT